MMTSDDKVGGWVKKGQNHDDVILEWSLIMKVLSFATLVLTHNMHLRQVNQLISKKKYQALLLLEKDVQKKKRPESIQE